MRQTTPDAVRSFEALQGVVRAGRWHRRATSHVVRQLLLHLVVAVVGLVLALGGGSLAARVIGVMLLVLGSVGVGTNSHTSSHYATSDRRWVNEALTYFGLPLFFQLSATYWWYKHVGRHHRSPNVVGIDHDIDLWPWFALTEEEYGRSHVSRARRLYYRAQWLVAPVAIAFNGFAIQLAGWSHLLRCLVDGRRRRTAHVIDLSMMVLHWVVWIAVPLAVVPVADVLVIYFARIVFLGYAFFVVLAPAHWPHAAVCLRPPGVVGDFIHLQTSTTLNFRTGWIGRLLCSGLEFQIEHHLFPQVSHVHYPDVSRMVREFCEREGYPYRTLGWTEAVWKSLRVFGRPKRVEARLEELAPKTGRPEALLSPFGSPSAPDEAAGRR